MQRIRRNVEEVVNHKGRFEKSHSESQTVFEELRDNPNLPPEEKTVQRLADEGSILLIAGSETPGKALAIVYYHLMANPLKMQRLRRELDTVMLGGSLPSQAELEKLPYLSAVVHEGLRLHSGIVARSQRVAPDALQYKQWTIPARTPLSCVSAFVHYDPQIFPEPRAFQPERWLEDGPDGPRIKQSLKRHLVAFGRGTRNCLGYNLGMAIMYFGIASVADGFDMELYETTFEDVNLERDWTIPQPRIGSQGVRAVILPRAKI